MDSMSNEQSAGNLKKGEWDSKNKLEFNKMENLNKASLDSINNVINKENLQIKNENATNRAKVDSTNKAREQALKDYNSGKITMNEAKSKGITFK